MPQSGRVHSGNKGSVSKLQPETNTCESHDNDTRNRTRATANTTGWVCLDMTQVMHIVFCALAALKHITHLIHTKAVVVVVCAGLRLNNAWASGTVLRRFIQPESPLSSQSLISGFKWKLRDSNPRPPYSKPRALTSRLYTDICGEHIQAFVILKSNVTKSSIAPVPFRIFAYWKVVRTVSKFISCLIIFMLKSKPKTLLAISFICPMV